MVSGLYLPVTILLIQLVGQLLMGLLDLKDVLSCLIIVEDVLLHLTGMIAGCH